MVRFVQGETPAQIGEERRVSEEAVKQELFHAADRLRNTIQEEDLKLIVQKAKSLIPTTEH